MDTSLEAEARQFEIWHAMSLAEKGEVVARASRALLDVQTQGLRSRFPEATEDELHLRAFTLRYGATLARLVYGDVPADLQT